MKNPIGTSYPGNPGSVPGTVLMKTIIRKTTGDITVSSLGSGEGIPEKILPFDCFIQVIQGSADLTIDSKQYQLKPGEGIIIPAHSCQRIHATENFKMITTTIKSGYE